MSLPGSPWGRPAALIGKILKRIQTCYLHLLPKEDQYLQMLRRHRMGIFVLILSQDLQALTFVPDLQTQSQVAVVFRPPTTVWKRNRLGLRIVQTSATMGARSQLNFQLNRGQTSQRRRNVLNMKFFMNLIVNGVFHVYKAAAGPTHTVLRITQRTYFLSLASTMVTWERSEMGIRSSMGVIPDIDGIMVYQFLQKVFSRNGLTRHSQSS